MGHLLSLDKRLCWQASQKKGIENEFELMYGTSLAISNKFMNVFGRDLEYLI